MKQRIHKKKAKIISSGETESDNICTDENFPEKTALPKKPRAALRVSIYPGKSALPYKQRVTHRVEAKSASKPESLEKPQSRRPKEDQVDKKDHGAGPEHKAVTGRFMFRKVFISPQPTSRNWGPKFLGETR